MSQLNIFNNNSWYKTTPMTVEEEIKAENQAVSQENKILQHLKETGSELTAWQIKDIFPSFEITSIRRALFNLEMKQEKIRQTGWVKERKGKTVGKYQAI